MTNDFGGVAPLAHTAASGPALRIIASAVATAGALDGLESLLHHARAKLWNVENVAVELSE
jgi:hypothetical protein